MSSIHNDPDLKPMAEQISYANILFWGGWAGIFILLATYFIYVTGILDPLVPMSVVPQYWGRGVNTFIHETGAPAGWTWLSMLGTGDYLNFVGLALLALLTIVCYLVLLPGFIRQKDWTFVTIVILEVLVLSVAASGILGSGGH